MCIRDSPKIFSHTLQFNRNRRDKLTGRKVKNTGYTRWVIVGHISSDSSAKTCLALNFNMPLNFIRVYKPPRSCGQCYKAMSPVEAPSDILSWIR